LIPDWGARQIEGEKMDTLKRSEKTIFASLFISILAIILMISSSFASGDISFDYVDVLSSQFIRFKNYVDDNVARHAAGTALRYGFSATDAVIMYSQAGKPDYPYNGPDDPTADDYANLAIDLIEEFILGEEALIAAGERPRISYDSYLYTRGYFHPIALTYDWCYDRLTQDQRDRWIAHLQQTVWNIWNHADAEWGGNSFPWSGWSVNNPGNNYYYHFIEATQDLAIITQDQTWIDFLRTVKFPQLITYLQGLPGGGSREGTGYGASHRHLFHNYGVWRGAMGEDLSSQTPHCRESIDYWLHATVPTFEAMAHIGDLAGTNISDYKKHLMLEAVALNPGTPEAERGAWWINNVTPIGWTWCYKYDILPRNPVATKPTTLLYHSTGTGHLFARSSWESDAAWMHFLCGPFVESHAHQDQGDFTFYKGAWLAFDENMYSHSGIKQAVTMHNIVRFENAGTIIPQNRDSNNHSSMTYTDEEGVLTINADLANAYSNSSQVTAWNRDVVFDKNSYTLNIHDTYNAGLGVEGIWQIQTPVEPIVQGNQIIAGDLVITPIIPAVPAIDIIDYYALDSTTSGYPQGGWRTELRGGNGEYEVALSLLSMQTAHTIIAASGAGGSINPVGSIAVIDGGSQAFTITPESGYIIEDVLVDGSSVGAATSYVFNDVTTDHTISASFVASAPVYSLTLNAVNGSITASPDQATYDNGTVVTLTAVPNAGYSFISWAGDASGSTNPITITMDSNKTVTASFDMITYTIAATAGAGGTITPSGDISIGEGADQTFTITPDAGYEISTVYIDGISLEAAIDRRDPYAYTFTNIAADHAITAEFTEQPSFVELVNDSFEGAPPTGWSDEWIATNHFGPHYTTDEAGAPVDGGTYSYCQAWTDDGNTPKVLFYNFPDRPGQGDIMEFEYWIKYDPAFDTNNSSGFKQIICQNDKVTEKNELYICIYGSNSDRVYIAFQHTTDTGVLYSNVNGPAYVMQKDEWVHFRWRIKVSVEANGDPRDGYCYGWINGTKRWHYEGLNTLAQGVYSNLGLNTTFNQVLYGPNQKRYWDLFKIRAMDVINDYTITPTAGTGGSISPSGAVVVNEGADQTFTITPDAGYRILDVLVDGSSVGAVTSYSFTDVTADHAIEARFSATSTNTLLLEDSFEGDPNPDPFYKGTGWSAGWGTTNHPGPHYTTPEAGTPAEGGEYAYCQAWTESSSSPKWLFKSFPETLGESDILEFEYWIKYDENFDFGDNGLKQIIAQGTSAEYFNEFYIIHLWTPQVVAFFQHTSDTSNLYANVNGPSYVMPTGEWVHFRWKVKVSVEADGDPRAGYLYGWVNGVQRWEYNNINTISQGEYRNIDLNTTFNSGIYGPNQKRYWDLFKIHTSDVVNNYSLTVTADNGAVIKDPDKTSYSPGETVTLTAIPDTGYLFVNWADDASGTDNPVRITMDSDKSVTAIFSPRSLLLHLIP
jgi:hypothetical protein